MPDSGSVLVKEARFLIALCLTLAVETPLFALCLRVWTGSGPGRRHAPDFKRPVPVIIGLPLIASALTLPYVWFVMPRFIRGYYPSLAASEAFAVFAEALVYAILGRFPPSFCVTASSICNAASLVIGFFLGPVLFAAR
jgi:hypothetical protein